jgi:cytoskeletal protein CcmA (bactofilin family)
MFEVKLKQDENPKAEALINAHDALGLGARSAPQIRPLYEVKPLAISAPVLHIVPKPNENGHAFQAKVPAITGEVTVRGFIAIDGVVSGQLNANGGTLTVKQRARSTTLDSQPELNGEICFKDMLRVNGHIAGRLISKKGTLIVDSLARVDADVEVAVATISGTVNGDIIGHQRVELGPAAIIRGNIRTRSLIVKPGAVFEGVCKVLKDEDIN